MKSYQRIAPSTAQHRAISFAICCLISELNIDVKTVCWQTKLNHPSDHGKEVAQPQRTSSEGLRCRAFCTGSGRRSMPARLAGSAPHSRNWRSKLPSPQPTSRMRRAPRGVKAVSFQQAQGLTMAFLDTQQMGKTIISFHVVDFIYFKDALTFL